MPSNSGEDTGGEAEDEDANVDWVKRVEDLDAGPTPDWYGEADESALESGVAYPPPGSPVTRPRGILSQRDREYLVGTSDIEQKTQKERNIRGDIRTRVKHALIDFTLLMNHLSPRDRQQIFDSRHAGIRDGIADALGFLYHETAPPRYDFEELLAMGIDRGGKVSLRREGYSPLNSLLSRDYYNVDLQVERVSPKNPRKSLGEIGDMLEDGDVGDLTPAEMRMFLDYYMKADDFDPQVPATIREEMSRRAQGWESAGETDDE